MRKDGLLGLNVGETTVCRVSPGLSRVKSGLLGNVELLVTLTFQNVSHFSGSKRTSLLEVTQAKDKIVLFSLEIPPMLKTTSISNISDKLLSKLELQ